jgi:hypothetical protein
MNIYIKKLITYLTLQIRTPEINTVVGYLCNYDWLSIINELINFDLHLLDLIEQDLDKNINKLKVYNCIFNDCYFFINEEFNISFLKEAAFNNVRVNNIKDFNLYILARKTFLKEFK